MLEQYVQQFLDTVTEEDAYKIINYCKCNNLYNIGLLLGKTLYKLFPHQWNILMETALCAYNTGEYKLSHDLFFKILDFSGLNDEVVKNAISNAQLCINHISDRYIHYNPTIVDSLMSRERKPFPLVTFTITTCKRFDLFEKSINSFLNCCEDIHLIDEWLCVDDNSSEEDRIKMKDMYPFFNFYFKSNNEKGHPQSMNIIRESINTPYYFHMEDDWQFFVKHNYISECLEILQSYPKLGQCLINKNYAETERDFIVGGIPLKTSNGTRYHVHEYTPTPESQHIFNKKYDYGLSCSYWPHFSFRPSLVRYSILKELGEFDVNVSHFEMDYSYRYINAGYESVFLETIYCLHIGRLTSERNDKNKPNAYDLNDEIQFVGKEDIIKEQSVVNNLKILNFNIIVINLDRRPDRWEQFQKKNVGLCYSRFQAVDGAKLVPNHQLSRIFDNNDYNMRKGMVGCAMSHIKIYIDLLNSQSDFYCVLEDDVELTYNFNEKLSDMISKQLYPTKWDLVYLGHHFYPQYREDLYYDKNRIPIIEKWDRQTSLKYSMGGTGGYLITKEGARKLLNFINRNGMTNGIDTVQQKSADELDIYYCNPHLIFSECYLPNAVTKIDTDIQLCYDSLTVDIEQRFTDEQEFYKNSPFEIITDYNTMKNYLTESNQDKVLFYEDDNPAHIYELQNSCIFPCYNLDNKILVVVPNPTQYQREHRYFERLNKNREFNIDDALLYK
jgi:GR25 family glycosyltransferase involved in LPS biosynthesis/GT2 family glycosyltransferase